MGSHGSAVGMYVGSYMYIILICMDSGLWSAIAIS